MTVLGGIVKAINGYLAGIIAQLSTPIPSPSVDVAVRRQGACVPSARRNLLNANGVDAGERIDQSRRGRRLESAVAQLAVITSA